METHEVPGHDLFPPDEQRDVVLWYSPKLSGKSRTRAFLDPEGSGSGHHVFRGQETTECGRSVPGITRDLSSGTVDRWGRDTDDRSPVGETEIQPGKRTCISQDDTGTKRDPGLKERGFISASGRTLTGGSSGTFLIDTSPSLSCRHVTHCGSGSGRNQGHRTWYKLCTDRAGRSYFCPFILGTRD